MPYVSLKKTKPGLENGGIWKTRLSVEEIKMV